MTPNIGQGANSGIEDAALFTSLLNSWVSTRTNQAPSSQSIKELFQTFQEKRYERIQKIYQQSRYGVRIHTRDDVVKIFTGRYIIPYLKDRLANLASKMIADGEIISFLPYPGRSGSSWSDHSGSKKNARPYIGDAAYFLAFLVALFGIAIGTIVLVLWN